MTGNSEVTLRYFFPISARSWVRSALRSQAVWPNFSRKVQPPGCLTAFETSNKEKQALPRFAQPCEAALQGGRT